MWVFLIQFREKNPSVETGEWVLKNSFEMKLPGSRLTEFIIKMEPIFLYDESTGFLSHEKDV